MPIGSVTVARAVPDVSNKTDWMIGVVMAGPVMVRTALSGMTRLEVRPPGIASDSTTDADRGATESDSPQAAASATPTNATNRNTGRHGAGALGGAGA